MSAMVDTNVLVYAADPADPSPAKTRVARELLSRPDLQLSVQVLSEFVANARHPAKLALDRDQERQWLRAWLRFPVAPLTAETFVAAIAIHRRHRLSHWDSMILAVASELGCDTLFSEDLQHGRSYDGVRVVNPFAELPG